MTEQSPAWLEYAGDAFFVILFLIVFFFFKPNENAEIQDDEFNEDEEPNELEKILVTETNKEEKSEENITEKKPDK